VVDLADRAATLEVAEQVAREHPRIGLLVNNAGVGLGGRFDQVTLDDFDWVMEINFRAAVVLTHVLLPSLLAEPGSHVANTSSVYGLYAPPGEMAYASSKFALRGFSQSLRAELAPRGVGVTTVHPGGVRTRVVENSRVAAAVDPADVVAATEHLAKLLTYPPEKAAAEILAGVEARKGRVLISSSAKVPDVAARLLPVSHQRVIDWLAQALERQEDRRLARARAAARTGTDT
jgi:short-subunit dehydrogenase